MLHVFYCVSDARKDMHEDLCILEHTNRCCLRILLSLLDVLDWWSCYQNHRQH